MLSVTDLILLAMSFVAALIGSWALLSPFFESAHSSARMVGQGEQELQNLLLRREAALDSLADLEEDFRGAKISSAEYAPTKSELMREATEIEQSLEKLSREP